ncbi:MAG: hypothetical protein FJ147_24190 [Deltaproteobacteria bacterium]|nr:hypothetical protein [Deltaproteobacteria bacterium]
MQRKASSQKYHRNAAAGHTLIELLVSIFMTGVMLAMITSLMQSSMTVKHGGSLETEAQQGLRGLLSMVTQELRQAGACLTTGGPFVALAGVDSTSQDTLTVRIGKVSPLTLQCVQTNANTAAIGATAITVDDASAFQAGDLVYIRESPATGHINTITAVDVAGKQLTLATGLPTAFPPAPGQAAVYAIEDRTYSIATVSGQPTLMISVDGGTPWPMVSGVEVFDVLYYLGPCALNGNGSLNCANAIPAPAPGAAAWSQVRAVGICAQIRSHMADKQGVIHRVTTDQAGAVDGYVMIKPRNLL